MKTKLLSLILMTTLYSGVANAQKTWDFGNNTAVWPTSTGTNAPQTTNDNLGLYACSPDATTQITTFAAVNNNNSTFGDGYTATQRLQLGGAGYTSAGGFTAKPTQRFVHFDVSGACTIGVWFRPSSNGATRSIFVTDGTTVIGTGTSNSGGTTDYVVMNVSYTGPAHKLYVYGDAGCNLYKIVVTGTSVTGPVLSNSDFQAESQVKVYSTGSQIYLSNIISKTQVEVYTITGALVNSISTEADTNFSVPTAGVYIVNVKSAEGKKSVKLVVK